MSGHPALDWLVDRIASCPGPRHDVVVVVANRGRVVPFLQALGPPMNERWPGAPTRSDARTFTTTSELWPGHVLGLRVVTAPQARMLLRGMAVHTGLAWEVQTYKGKARGDVVRLLELATSLSLPSWPAMHRVA